MANIKLNQEEFSDLHRLAKAVKGQIYELVIDGETVFFIGNETGRLRRDDDVDGEVEGRIKETIINELDRFSREDLIRLLSLIEEFEASDIQVQIDAKIDTCKAIAMNIAL